MFNKTDKEYLKSYLLKNYKTIRSMIEGTVEAKELCMLEGNMMQITKMWQELLEEPLPDLLGKNIILN